MCPRPPCGGVFALTATAQMKDPSTNDPIFNVLQVQLSCQKCKDDGKSASCNHMLHLAPRWQSSERHRRLKTIMQDRPGALPLSLCRRTPAAHRNAPGADLIQSELAGLAFDSLQQAFAAADIERMFAQDPLEEIFGQPVYMVIDPAAGGPQSDYAIVSFTRDRGLVTVRTLKHCGIRRARPPRSRAASATRPASNLRWCACGCRGRSLRCVPRRGRAARF